jgi:outer membrane protein TolC
MRGGFAWLAAAALAATWPAAAETLQDAWRMALRQNQALAAAAADVEAARANESAARAARWPTVRASAAYTRLDQAPALAVSSPALEFRSPPIFAGDDFVMGSGEVTLPLYTGGQVRSGIRAASEALAGATQDERSAIAALKLDTARAYVGVLRARKALRTSESRVASLAAHAADVEHMVERELVATSDLLAARVALANAEQERVRAANGLKVAEAAYNRWLGEPLDRDVDLDERIATDPALASEAIDGLVKEALDSRSEIKSAAARAQALESQSRAEVGKLLPQLALTGSYTYFENEILDRQNAAAVGIGIEWNLFDGGQTRSRAAALRGAGRAAERRAADLRSQIELEVRAAVLDVGAARARLAAMHEAVAQAEENLRTSRELYGAGLATNTQVLDAVALRVSAINNHDDAELDEVLAQLRLAYAVGRL